MWTINKVPALSNLFLPSKRKVKTFHFASNLQEITPVLLLFDRHCKQIVTKREIKLFGESV